MPAIQPVFRVLLVVSGRIFGGLKPENRILSSDSCMCANGIDKKPEFKTKISFCSQTRRRQILKREKMYMNFHILMYINLIHWADVYCNGDMIESVDNFEESAYKIIKQFKMFIFQRILLVCVHSNR